MKKSSREASASETTPLRMEELNTMDYNSDSAVYDNDKRSYLKGLSFKTREAMSDGSPDENDDDVDDDNTLEDLNIPRHLPPYNVKNMPIPMPRSQNKKSAFRSADEKKNRATKRSRIRSLNRRFMYGSSKRKHRVSAYCTCELVYIFKLKKWLERVETGELPGSELSLNGWKHRMFAGVIHSTCGADSEEGLAVDPILQKDVFYFANGCVVFWGLTRSEELRHVEAIGAFSRAPVKQVEVEDMEYYYGESSKIVNDSISLSTTDPHEKIAISFAMAQSAKLDVFESRVEDTIKQTKHVPENLALTGSIKYSQTDISKLIGRLFIERNDVNLNSDMLDEPDFFWENDEWEPLYSKMMRYLDVSSRVQILNARLDILRELLDVLSQQLANQHASYLEWIIIWLILAEVVVQVVWNMLIKDILGYFPNCSS